MYTHVTDTYTHILTHTHTHLYTQTHTLIHIYNTDHFKLFTMDIPYSIMMTGNKAIVL